MRAIIPEELSGQNCFLTEDKKKHNLRDRIEAVLLNRHGVCLHSAAPRLPRCIQIEKDDVYDRVAVPSQYPLLYRLCLQALTSSQIPTQEGPVQMYHLRSNVAKSLCTFNFNVIHR